MASNAEDFILRLQQQVSGPAAVARSALAQLEERINAERAALGGLEEQLGTAAAKLRTLGEGSAKGDVAIGAYRRQQAALAALQAEVDKTRGSLSALEGARGLAEQADAMKAAAAAAKELEAAEKAAAAAAKDLEKSAATQAAQTKAAEREHVKQTATLTRAAGATSGARLNVGELGEALGKLGGPLGSAGGQMGQLGAAFSKLAALGPAGIIAAIVVAVVALGVALVAAVVAATRFAVGMADAARTQRLALDGLAASSPALADVARVIKGVQASTGATTDSLRQMASQLAAAGVSAQDLPDALKAIALATEGGATAEVLKRLNDDLKAGTKSAAQLRAEMEKTFGPIVRAKMLSLDAQSAKLKDHFKTLFAGLKIEALLEGLSKLVALFDANTASGKALQFLLEKLFQPLIDAAASALPTIERVFLTLVVWALRAFIALKPYEAQIRMVAEGLAIMGAVLGGAVLVGWAILAVLIGVVVSVLLAIAQVLGAVVQGFKINMEIMGGWVTAAIDAVSGVFEFLSSVDLVQIGRDMISGLANGITAGASAVVSAITGVVSNAIAAAKSLLQQKSPSKVFAGLGLNTSLGYAEGVDAGAPEARGAVETMVSPPAVPSAGASHDTGGRGSSSRSVSFTNCTFGGDLTEDRLRGWMVKIFGEAELEAEPAT